MRGNFAGATLVASIVAMMLAAGISRTASAAPFLWLNDPNSDINFSGVTPSCGDPTLGKCSNSITYSGFQAVNGGSAQSDIGLFLPFIWPRDESKSPPQQAVMWNNSLGGWQVSNFDNLGTSLLIKVDITTPNNLTNGTVLAGQVADVTGSSEFGPSSDSPSVGAPFPRETLAANDALPFVDLGAFAANQAKTFGLEFTYEFGDGRSCDFVISCRTTLAVYTLAPEPEPLSEPATAALLGAGILGLLAARRRSTK